MAFQPGAFQADSFQGASLAGGQVPGQATGPPPLTLRFGLADGMATG